MKNTRIFIIAFVVALMLVFTACTSTPITEAAPSSDTAPAADSAAPAADAATPEADAGAKQATNEPYKVGFCLQSMDVAVWNTMSEGMKAKAEELGAAYDCQVANNDVATQISNIENMIAQGYDAIIIHAFDREAFADVVNQALSKGIVICAYDDNIIDSATGEACKYQLTFLCDNYQIGYNVGQMAAEWTKATFQGEEPLQFGLLWHKEFQYQRDRVDGIRDAIAKFDPRIEIVEELEGLVTEDGVKAAEAWMQSYPNLKGVVATNDTALLGFAEAWKAAGKDVMDTQFGMFGNDGVKDAIDMVADGTILRGDVGLDVYNGGADTVQACINVLNGEPAESVVMPMVNVTADTADVWKADKNLYK